MLRDDSAVMLSPTAFREFVQPYDQQVLDTFGGCIHFCGRGEHFIDAMAECRQLYGINMSQPELNNMDHIWELVQRKQSCCSISTRSTCLPESIPASACAGPGKPARKGIYNKKDAVHTNGVLPAL